MNYTYKPGARIKAPAQVAGEICEKLAAENNLTPEALLDASRSEDSPLHGEFEWDDSVAAEEYRKTQAATIIRMITIVPEEKPEIVTRAFVRASDEVHHFMPYRKAISTEDSRLILLKNAIGELKAFRYKYSSLSELAGINSAIDTFIQEAEVS